MSANDHPTPACLPRTRTSALLCTAAVLVLLGACSGKEGRIESGLKKAGEFVAQGDLDKANVEVRNVLQIDPKNARAFVISAQISEGQRDVQRAYGSYLKAVELKPDLVDARLGLARIYLFAGEIGRAEPMIRELLASDDKNLGARTLSAALLAKRGQVAQALAETRALIDAQKTAPAEASILLAGILANQGKPAEALAAIDRALKDDPRNQSLLQVAASVTGSLPAGDPLAAKADGYYRTASQEAPRNNELRRAWAAHHAARGEVDRAEAVMREGIKAQPKDSQRVLDLVSFLASARSVAAAEKAAREAIATSPRDMSLRLALVSLYQSAQRPAEAQQVLKEVVSLADDPASQLQAKAQLAQYASAAGRAAEARTLVTEILKASPRDNAALLLRGRLDLRDGKAQDAVQALRQVVKDQPGSVEAVGLLAQAHRAAGEAQLGREVLAEAVKARPEDPDLRLLLVADMIDAKDLRNAQAELDTGLRTTPQAARLYEIKASLALAQNDPASAERTFVALRQATPQQPVGSLRLGQLYMQQGRYDAALKSYDAAAVVAPKDVTPYIAAVGLLVGTKRYDEANQRIEARQKDDPANVLHHQLRGDVAMSRQDLPAAERAYRAAIQAAPHAGVGYINTARVLGTRGDLAAALALLVEGEKAAPEDIKLPQARAEWLTRGGRTDEAIALYETLHQRAPDNDDITNNLAFLLAEVKGDRASVERALALAGRFADSRNAGHLDSLGWIHHKLGQYDKAVPLLERAVALAPGSPTLNLHLGQALVKSGNAARAKPYLRKAIESKSDLPNREEVKALLAQG